MLDQRFGKLLVLTRAQNNTRNETMWACICDCGNHKIIKGSNLRTGKTQSCGCLKTGPKSKDLVGKRYNQLLVIKYSHTDKWRIQHYYCKCDCGRLKIVSSRNLITGTTLSCGCWKKIRDNCRNGSNNPNWNPNRSDDERIIGRNVEEYHKWSYEIKRRHNFSCVICYSNKSNTLISHHLYNYRDYPAKRTDLDNGVCLCRSCHLEFHKQYGFRRNTRQQWEQFYHERSICNNQ